MILKDENFKLDSEYKIVSIFDKVINLEKDDEIYSIFDEGMTFAPYTIILNKELFSEYKTYKKDDIIYIPDMKTKNFSCYLESKKYKFNLDNLINRVKLFQREENIFENYFQNKRNTQNLIELIGLGQGLTPSGDDYIVGIMAAFYLENNFTPNIFNTIVKEAKNKTNKISYNYLKNGKNRLFKKEILDLIYDLDNIEKIKKLEKFGSSSGQDIIYGIHDYFVYKMKIY